jgi:iron complex outermembrane receptor protein
MKSLTQLQRNTLRAFTLLISTQTFAQDTEQVYELSEFTVSSGPVARDASEFASPLSILTADDIRREGGSTLGELLSSQPGVTASSFGPGSSRPIIRGFDGPRVRILDSAIEAADASETSPDHAVATEPMLVDRVEIIRGPATLLYGSSAIGGVVNVVGKEIPRERVGPKGYEGAFEARHNTASEGETLLSYGKAGGENWAISLTGLSRETEDYEIPDQADLTNPATPGRLDNSFIDSEAYSAGGSWFFGERNYIGAAVSRFESVYGVPGEPVFIDLERDRFHAEMVAYEPVAWIEAARARFGYTDYTHTEVEGGNPGTVFDRESWEFRADASHEDWALADEGVFGFQVTDSDLSAIGDEAFIPASTTQSQAIFISEHIHGEELHYEFGGRLERQDASAAGTPDDYDDVALSLAVGMIWNFDKDQSISLNLQRSERHPISTELYANGPHLATEQFEIGDSNLEKETAYGLDLSYEYQSENWDAVLTLFYTRFDDYIFAENLGFQTDPEGRVLGDVGFDAGEALDTYQFAAVDADFWGFEAEIDRVIYATGNSRLTVGLLADYVHAENRNDNAPLPRIPPMRIGLRADLESGPWTAGLLLRRALEQDRIAGNETETSGYNEFNFDVERVVELGNGLQLSLFARLDNLLDEDIRHHTSFLKDIAPLPGRSATIGARLEF